MRTELKMKECNFSYLYHNAIIKLTF